MNIKCDFSFSRLTLVQVCTLHSIQSILLLIIYSAIMYSHIFSLTKLVQTSTEICELIQLVILVPGAHDKAQLVKVKVNMTALYDNRNLLFLGTIGKTICHVGRNYFVIPMGEELRILLMNEL